MRWNFCLAPLMAMLAAGGVSDSGAAIYQARCGFCHATGRGDAPPLRALREMGAAFVRATIDDGIMKERAAGLNGVQRAALVRYVMNPRTGGKAKKSGAVKLKGN